MRADLGGWNLGRAMFVSDSGMNSIKNREELCRACGRYLVAILMDIAAEVKRHVLTRPGRYAVITDILHAKDVVLGDGERPRR